MDLPIKKKHRRAALHALQKGRCCLEELGQCLLPGVPMTLERGERSRPPPDTFATLEHLVPKSQGGPVRPVKVSHYKCNHTRGDGTLSVRAQRKSSR